MKKVNLDSCKNKEKKQLVGSCAMYHIIREVCLVDNQKCPLLKTVHV